MTRAAAVWRYHQGADLVATVAAVAVAEVALRIVGLRRMTDALHIELSTDAALTEPAPGPDLPRWAQMRLRTVSQVLRWWPFGDTCLRRAVVGAWRVRRLEPAVVIGVRFVDGQLEAHAWMRLLGRDLDPEAAAYTTLDIPSVS